LGCRLLPSYDGSTINGSIMPSQDRFFLFCFFQEIFSNDVDSTIFYIPDGVYDKIFFKVWEMRLKDGRMAVNGTL
jgi:hypothetical protein